MKKDTLDDIDVKVGKRRFNLNHKHLGWIVAAALLIYFNLGPRAFAADVEPAPAELEWNTVLKHFQIDADKFVGQRFHFQCPERTVRDEDDTLYGTAIYPSDSPICVAAVHAGAIGTDGGSVIVQLNPGIESYQGSERHGIRSGDFPETQRSLVFVGGAFAETLDPVQRDYAPRLKWDTKFTSTGLANMKLVGQRFVFSCPAAPASLAGRRVYGTDRYAFNSYVCLAAVHAGRLGPDGGFVTVQMVEPTGKLKGSIRNGIESKDGAAGTRQLIFPVIEPAVATTQP